jgi:hypothetical protein
MNSKDKIKSKTKKNLMGALDEKVFFVIKYWMMSFFQGLAIILIVFFMGVINAVELIILGVILFVVSLVISRRFDKNISSLAVKIGKKLASYPKLEKLLLKNI